MGLYGYTDIQTLNRKSIFIFYERSEIFFMRSIFLAVALRALCKRQADDVYDVWMATIVVSLCGVVVQELVLKHRHTTQRHGLQKEAHHTSYHFFLYYYTRKW